MANNVYKTIDGRIFESFVEANIHEEQLFLAWVASNPKIDIASTLAALDDESKDEYWGTERDLFLSFLRDIYGQVGHKHTVKVGVYLQKSDEGGYLVHVPSLPGVVSEGETIESAMINIKDALELVLGAYRENGQQPPWTGAAIQDSHYVKVAL